MKSPLTELFDQIIDGADIPRAEAILRVSVKRAAMKLDSAPYSMLTNLAHAVTWQRLWLDTIEGRPTPPVHEVWMNDFRVPAESEWAELKADFIAGLARARELSLAPDLSPGQVRRLLHIAVHASYHLGQLNLLKRQLSAKLRASAPEATP